MWIGEAADLLSVRLSENAELMKELLDTLSFGNKGLDNALKVYRDNEQEIITAVKSIL